jgi:hypothetical protein
MEMEITMRTLSGQKVLAGFISGRPVCLLTLDTMGKLGANAEVALALTNCDETSQPFCLWRIYL